MVLTIILATVILQCSVCSGRKSKSKDFFGLDESQKLKQALGRESLVSHKPLNSYVSSSEEIIKHKVTKPPKETRKLTTLRTATTTKKLWKTTSAKPTSKSKKKRGSSEEEEEVSEKPSESGEDKPTPKSESGSSEKTNISGGTQKASMENNSGGDLQPAGIYGGKYFKRGHTKHYPNWKNSHSRKQMYRYTSGYTKNMMAHFGVKKTPKPVLKNRLDNESLEKSTSDEEAPKFSGGSDSSDD